MSHDTTKEESMPQIIVTADRGAAFVEGAVTLRERVSVADFESQHFATQLVERLGWAVGDAHEVERIGQDETAAQPLIEPSEPITDACDRLSVPSPA
jgi:hypothetical protein